MPINDYLQGINNATSGQTTDVTTATNDLSQLQVGAGSIQNKLKEALNLKLNYNKDIINQQSATMENYFNSGATAREKYQGVWNPFEKAKLVQQDRSMALRPYDTLTGVLDQRMGDVADITTAGVSGWQGMVDAATTKLGTAKDMLSTALQSYLGAADQQAAADDMAFKIAEAEEASRQFEKNYGLAEQNYGLETKKFDEGVRQFNVSESNKLRIAGMNGSGKSGQLTSKDVSANTKAMQDEARKILADPKGGLAGVYQYIKSSESSLGKYGVDPNDLWGIWQQGGGNAISNPAPKTNSSFWDTGFNWGAKEQIEKYGSTDPLAWNDAKQTWTPGGK